MSLLRKTLYYIEKKGILQNICSSFDIIIREIVMVCGFGGELEKHRRIKKIKFYFKTCDWVLLMIQHSLILEIIEMTSSILVTNGFPLIAWTVYIIRRYLVSTKFNSVHL